MHGEYMTYTINGIKWVPKLQVDQIIKERDALLIANKNLQTMLSMYQRAAANVHNDAE